MSDTSKSVIVGKTTIFLHINTQTQNFYVRSNEGLPVETSALEILYGEQFTSSTQLIKPSYLIIPPIDAAPQFL